MIDAEHPARLIAIGAVLEPVAVAVGEADEEIAAVVVEALPVSAADPAETAGGQAGAPAFFFRLHEELGDAADRVLAVERRGRPLDKFDALDEIRRNQRDIGIALQNAQRHAVDEHQHVLRIAQPARFKARIVIALRPVLQAGYAAQAVFQCDGAGRIQLAALNRGSRKW